jgi:hypothetical protein
MEYPTIREAVAVFDDSEKLESAVSELQSSGIDRSELSLLAHLSLDACRAIFDGLPRIQRPHANPLLATPICVRDACSAPASRRPLRRLPELGSLLTTGASQQQSRSRSWSREHACRTQTRRRPDVVPRRTARARLRVTLGARTRNAASEQTVLEVIRRNQSARNKFTPSQCEQFAGTGSDGELQ